MEKPQEDAQKWVGDSSVDHKGRVPRRASTGCWKASLFIIVIEFSERLSYFGLATNLIIYLTKVLHEEVKTAAKNVNYWSGVTTMMPLVGGFVADAYLGRFSTVVISSLIYIAVNCSPNWLCLSCTEPNPPPLTTEDCQPTRLPGEVLPRCHLLPHLYRGKLLAQLTLLVVYRTQRPLTTEDCQRIVAYLHVTKNRSKRAVQDKFHKSTNERHKGLVLLMVSELVPRLKPCDPSICGRSLRLHEVIFFLAMYLISVGTGGHKPSLESFGADQFDDNHDEERKKKMSYFNWWNFALCSGLMLGVTMVVYVQDAVGWWLADVVLTAVMCFSLVVFVVGSPFYRYRAPEGSPFKPMLQVVVAAAAKRHLPLPSDAGELYEVPKTQKSDKRLLCHTNQLRFLDRAAIVEHKYDEAAFAAEKHNSWRLATVTQVEELKLILSMVPIWLAALPFGICVAQANTFFIKQGSVMDRQVTNSFKIPPASVYSLSAIGMIVSVTFYDKLLVPFLRKATGNERGISILKRIGIGMAITTVAMISAALVERKRLRVAVTEQTSVVSMSVFWLLPQFVIMGIGDGFALVGLQEYFYDQVPDGMRSLGIAFYLSVLGAANFLSSLLITIVDHITSREGKGSWFAKDLNKSRLDLYYWLIATISAVNLCGYVYLARRYSYKKVQRKVAVADSPRADV
ncbi:unnamed protein product [Musa acuminata subsp. malaccensis]|uniref:(wild Malaysian banana) hypothetical protein n=1 Tax=Musa acuminata subsp. malaccensis TaxID=214687 RepID=A0A804KZ52_MUSAM|nr:unnamed protein product [Musa acuminata subsp. malaccensis]